MNLTQNLMYLIPFLVTIAMGFLLKSKWSVKGSEKYEQFWKGYATSATLLTFFAFMFWVLPSLLRR
ncbi:hypothetical protein [Neobacillus vireti]|uniref:Uncharacterized protein n=1 Tax=Neobacillus vireti LMG 21834 TaxID=1131730 RepID=A0AB94IKZ7_9BACI|nr:hypothetical protein [Neobacillus vireti]ETI67751.1 hypothetical protein BAVI_15927 [Neobacillus vireti LMG 21834]KLT16121.1 hypothetical protein AA980_19335 [Neobacillus vireti]